MCWETKSFERTSGHGIHLMFISHANFQRTLSLAIGSCMDGCGISYASRICTLGPNVAAKEISFGACCTTQLHVRLLLQRWSCVVRLACIGSDLKLSIGKILYTTLPALTCSIPFRLSTAVVGVPMHVCVLVIYVIPAAL